METYCSDNELTINIEKTKCMIFNKTGRLIRRNFSINNLPLETVRSYKYLGFMITPSGEISTGLNDLRDRAMKAFYKLKNSLGTSFHRYLKTTLHLLDTLVKPILLYASDFWGCLKMPKDNPIEKFHHMACKQILGVQKQTTNIGVLLELGRIPLQIYAIKSTIKNWERIKTMGNNNCLKKSSLSASSDNLIWISSIQNTLNRNGLSCYYTRANNNDAFVHNKVFQRISDIFHQEAFATIQNPDSKLRTYGLIKSKPGVEKYLYEIINPQIRQACTKFRLSNHTLNIEIGRHKNLKEELRICPFCPNKVESEMHFLFDCSTFKSHRVEMTNQIIKHQRAFVHYSKVEKLQYLFSDEIIKITAKCIHDWLEIRTFLKDQPRNLS